MYLLKNWHHISLLQSSYVSKGLSSSGFGRYDSHDMYKFDSILVANFDLFYKKLLLHHNVNCAALIS